MKRLLILTTAVILTVGTMSGCGWFNRGSSCNTCGPVMGSDPYMSAPAVVPGATYVPQPG